LKPLLRKNNNILNKLMEKYKNQVECNFEVNKKEIYLNGVKEAIDRFE